MEAGKEVRGKGGHLSEGQIVLLRFMVEQLHRYKVDFITDKCMYSPVPKGKTLCE